MLLLCLSHSLSLSRLHQASVRYLSARERGEPFGYFVMQIHLPLSLSLGARVVHGDCSQLISGWRFERVSLTFL